MDLSQEWNNFDQELKHKAEHIDLASISIDAKSHHLIQELLFKLQWKLRWIRIINLPILAATFFVHGDLRILAFCVFITYELGRAWMMKTFRKIKTGIDYNESSKQVLDRNLIAVKSILKGEMIFSYIFLPLSAPIGFLAYQLFVHETLENVVSLPYFFPQIILVSLVGIPFIFIVRKMNDSIFKEPLGKLNQKIEELTDLPQ